MTLFVSIEKKNRADVIAMQIGLKAMTIMAELAVFALAKMGGMADKLIR